MRRFPARNLLLIRLCLDRHIYIIIKNLQLVLSCKFLLYTSYILLIYFLYTSYILLIYFSYTFYIPFYNILTYMGTHIYYRSWYDRPWAEAYLMHTYTYISSPAGLIISALIKPFMIRYCSIVFTQFSTPTRSLFSVRS